ncbi:hypothetical protein CYMTET_22486, partial [Cymbomonas tetramitiformis]
EVEKELLGSAEARESAAAAAEPCEAPVRDRLTDIRAGMLQERQVVRLELPSLKTFRKEYFKQDKPVVLTGVGRAWPALTKWQDFQWLSSLHGHRYVPLELGRHTDSTWREEVMGLKQFIEKYLLPTEPPEVAYIAQHHIFEQVSAQRRIFEQVSAQRRIFEQVSAQRRIFEQVSPQRRIFEQVSAQRRIFELVSAQRRIFEQTRSPKFSQNEVK